MKFNFNFRWLFALSFWLFVVHVRLFRETNTIILIPIILDYYESFFISLFFTTFLLSLVMYFFIYNQYQTVINTEKQQKFNLWIKNEFHWVITLLEFFDRSKTELYNKIFYLFTPLHNTLIIFTKWVLDNPKKLRLILFVGIVLPRVIIVLCLIIEIYLGELKYYFYSLIFLLIPLSMQLIIYMLQDIGSKFFPLIKEYAIVSHLPPNNGQDSYFCESQFVYFKREYAYCDLPVFVNNFFIPLLTISIFMKNDILPFFNKIKLFTLYYYFLSKTMCWAYIIVVLIQPIITK